MIMTSDERSKELKRANREMLVAFLMCLVMMGIAIAFLIWTIAQT